MRKKEEDIANDRNKTGAPLPEAAFARQRAAAIEAVVRAEPKARSEIRLRHELGVVATAVAAETVAASAGVAEKAQKRAADAATSYREAEMQAKKARTKIAAKTVQAFVGAGRGCNDGVASALPGVALTLDEDSSVHAALRKRRFKLVHNPLNFVEQVLAVRARAPHRGHLVIVPHGVRTDFAVCARLAAALLGTHMATAEEYLAKGRSCGCHFLPTYNNKPKPKLMVGVSPAIAKEFPTAPMLLQHIAQAAGSRIEFAREPRVVERNLKKAANSNATAHTCRIYATQVECNEVRKKYKLAYANGNDFLRLLQTVAPDAVACPGFD